MNLKRYFIFVEQTQCINLKKNEKHGTSCNIMYIAVGDLPLDVICEKAKSFGFDGVELGLPSHLDVRQTDPEYYRNIKVTLDKYGLQLFCISNHLVGQAICDNIDQRHKSVLPDYIWGDGDPDGVHLRAVENMIQAAHAARMLGVDTVSVYGKFDLAMALLLSSRYRRDGE